LICAIIVRPVQCDPSIRSFVLCNRKDSLRLRA
jgi:hypothetical protein